MAPLCIQVGGGGGECILQLLLAGIHLGSVNQCAACSVKVLTEHSISTLKEISRIPGNPDSFQVISGKRNNSRKFQEIQDFGKSTKTCRKYDFYGKKKQLYFF